VNASFIIAGVRIFDRRFAGCEPKPITLRNHISGTRTARSILKPFLEKLAKVRFEELDETPKNLVDEH
jgi:hypothetical protein